jgi:hypothetical protein
MQHYRHMQEGSTRGVQETGSARRRKLTAIDRAGVLVQAPADTLKPATHQGHNLTKIKVVGDQATEQMANAYR